MPGPRAALKLKVVLDTSEVPEMAPWAAEAKGLCEKNFPMICEHLGAEGFTPPTEVKIVFKKMQGIAHTSGTTITCADAWFKAHADDYGAVIHELCHVVQAYAGQPVDALWAEFAKEKNK